MLSSEFIPVHHCCCCVEVNNDYWITHSYINQNITDQNETKFTLSFLLYSRLPSFLFFCVIFYGYFTWMAIVTAITVKYFAPGNKKKTVVLQKLRYFLKMSNVLHLRVFAVNAISSSSYLMEVLFRTVSYGIRKISNSP